MKGCSVQARSNNDIDDEIRKCSDGDRTPAAAATGQWRPAVHHSAIVERARILIEIIGYLLLCGHRVRLLKLNSLFGLPCMVGYFLLIVFTDNSLCSLCSVMETQSRIVIHCKFAQSVWCGILHKFDIP
ncbi:uncharacterized protein LOC130015531 [Mercurialis annua]|uniref:uncharacterized protein LOC130015531 n=1 Tax=Mercurialis annua TaxID=3986 RepID=UPI0024ACBD6B|nr:uncharacterized protein LOC130015531 [Mercurialis annua]